MSPAAKYYIALHFININFTMVTNFFVEKIGLQWGLDLPQVTALMRYDYAQSGKESADGGAVSSPIAPVAPMQQTKCTRSPGHCSWLRGALWFSLATCSPQPSWLFSEGSRTPLQEPSVSPTRLSIILTAALNLSFFCKLLLLQATVIRFTCVCL